MKHKILIIIFLLLCFSCYIYFTTKNYQYTSLSHIDIYYVNFEIETVISVDCNDFHNAFSTEIKNISIIDKKILTQFEHEFKSLKLANSDMPTPDTRIQIKAYRGENVELYCIGQFTIIKNDELYNFSDSFRGLLEKINVIR